MHPAAAATIGDADHGRRQHTGLRHERPSGLRDDLDRVRQQLQRVGDRSLVRPQGRHRLGVARRQSSSDIEQLELQAMRASRPHHGAGEIDRAGVRAGVERLRADVEREPVRHEPERPRLDEQRDRRHGIDAELAGEGDAARRIGRVEAHVDARAGRVRGELLELAAESAAKRSTPSRQAPAMCSDGLTGLL